MNNDQTPIDKLEAALRTYGADYGFVITDKEVKKLLGASDKAKFEIDGCTTVHLTESITDIGKVIEQSDDETEFVAVVGAGIANKNIAMLVVKLCGNIVEVHALAREGLIRQGTARQAITKLEQSIVAKCKTK